MRLLITLITILVITTAISAVLIITVLIVVSNIKFKPFDKSDIVGIKISDLVQGKKLTISINSYIENQNNFKINFSDLYIQIFHNNELIANSTTLDTKKHTLPANGNVTLPESIDIYGNQTTINIVKDIALYKPVKVNYKLDVKVFGIKIPNRFTDGEYIIQL